jgi:hypothetical protein
MSDEFPKVCAEVLRDTKWIASYEECRPHFQRVLDYIHEHSSERDGIAKILGEFVDGGGYVQLSLVEFLMSSLKWPEIRVIAEARCAREGNLYWEVKHLLDVYEPVA